MATYNGSRYLREQLNSILCQLLPNDELIVSDDNSTDDTRSIVESYKDRRILLICNPSTRGHIRNFANAMAKARGEFIVLSDQDDIWVEHRLERMLRLLQRSPQSSLAVGDLVELDQRGLRRVERRLRQFPVEQSVSAYSRLSGQGEILRIRVCLPSEPDALCSADSCER